MLETEKLTICFDGTNSQWTKNNEYNLTYLKYQEIFLQNILERRGWLTVATAREALGAPPIKDIELYQYGWEHTPGNRVEFELTSYVEGPSYLVKLLGVTKIM